MTTSDKVRENRLRRAAARQGLTLVRSRQRDPRGLDYGRYWLRRNDAEVLTTKSLDDVESYLSPSTKESAE